MKLPTAPKGGAQKAEEILGDLLRRPDTSRIHFAKANTRTLELSKPHRSHVLDLEELAAGQFSSAFRSIGWRYLVMEGHRCVAEVELSDDLEFIGLHSGPYTMATPMAIESAVESDKAGKSDFELCYLRIPALHTVCVWMKGKTSYFIPVGDAPEGLESGRLYSEKEMIEILQPLADTVQHLSN